MKKMIYVSTFIITSLIVSFSNDDDPIPAPVVVPETENPTITLVGSSTINIY